MSNKEKKKIETSVFDNEQDLLKAILRIHIGTDTFEVDPMFFKGNFYKEIPYPNYCYDKNRGVCWKIKVGVGSRIPDPADATNLHWFEDEMMNSIILDPPFMFGVHGKTKEYYSSATHGIFRDFDELRGLYKGILNEAYRLLRKGGHLVFKCQDYTDSRSTFTHCFVKLWANEVGFYAKDLAILNLPKNKVANPNLTQRHLRKVHSYFWVFRK